MQDKIGGTAPQAGSAARPIFVVGSPRSGTTLLRLILDSHPSIACGPETNVLADLDESLNRHWNRLQRFGPDKAYWHAAYRDLFGRFMAEYAASKGKARWADKTPSYAEHLQFITALFPEAQVIHIIRDVRYVTASARSRWGWRLAWTMPETWRRSVKMAQEFGSAASSDQYREVRFEELVGATEETLRGVFDWLGESWDPRVLDYDRQEHLGGGPLSFTVSKAARERGGTAIDPSRADRPSHALDPILKARIERTAGALNRELGYG